MTRSQPRILCVATHHKTGTSWMQSVFLTLARELKIPIRRIPVLRQWKDLPEQGRVMVVNWRSNFAPGLLAKDDARFFHIIRDPRDVLLSGARYHETTDGKNEKFLYRPQPELGGKSYQEHLRSLGSFEEKLEFEMQGKHLQTMNKMVGWDYANPRSFETRYEDLIQDAKAEIFSEALRFLGFSDPEVQAGTRIFIENSLFGAKGNEIRKRDHVVSGRPAQWMSGLPRSVAKKYLERHGDDLITLGYETDKNWLDRLSEPTQALEVAGK